MTDKRIDRTRFAFDLVAIDVDGTLLDSHNKLTDETEAAIHAVRDQGIGVTLVSGRGHLPLRELLQRLDLQQPFIGSGGAYIADPITGQVIEHSLLDRKDIEIIVGLARAAQVGIFFEEQQRLIGEAKPEFMNSIRAISGVEVTETQDILRDTEEAPTKMFMTSDHAVLVSLEHEIRQRQLNVNLVYSAPIYLEATRLGVNKGSGLHRLAAHLGIPVERIAVIGDGGNDVSMFQVAGLAIAMGNALPEVKAAADVIAPTNDAGGVAWALRELILKQTS
jgi:Cof subfamily protein (haloacid dehalogenase superfamily)